MDNVEETNQIAEILNELIQGSSEENKEKLEKLADGLQNGAYTEDMKLHDSKLEQLGLYEKRLYRTNPNMTTRVRKKMIDKEAKRIGLNKIMK